MSTPVWLRSIRRAGRVVLWTSALTVLTLLAGIGIVLTVPHAEANIVDPATGLETNLVGLALTWTPSRLGKYAPVAANFSLYDERGTWVDTSTCESFAPGSGMKFLPSSPHNRMPTDKNMSFTLTLYAHTDCFRTSALWDFSGIPTAQSGQDYQWITESDWKGFAGGTVLLEVEDVIPGRPGHSWFAGQHCPAICPS